MKEDLIISEKEKLAETRARLEKKQKLINEKERKIRLKNLIGLGDLITRAGLEDFDHKILLGALLEIKESSKEPTSLKKWEEKQNAWQTTSHLRRLIVSFEGEPSENGVSILRSRKFKWNPFRQEWYGFGRKEDLETVLGKDHAKITEIPG